jgi:alkylation response protein AidB-like acyl-CoA dehydrogenase
MALETTIPAFPAGREPKRRVLLDAVAGVAATVAAHGDESEKLGTLAPALVEAMDRSGLWAMKLPAELGGAEADPVTQIMVIEAATYLDTAVGWSTMIGATSIGWPGAFLPDSAIELIFAGGRIPTCAGIGGVTGSAVAVEGGYKLTGRFAFASGIRHAEWLIAGARIATDGDEPPEERMFTFPYDESYVLDNWDVAGLRGTGSNDFEVSDLFVPADFTWGRTEMANGAVCRGGPIYKLGWPGFTAMEHGAFSLGAGHRALDLVIELAKSKRRGFAAAPTIAERPVFQGFVAEADLRLRACRGLMFEAFEEAWQVVCDGRVPDRTLQMKMIGSSVLATDTAVDVAGKAFRYAGGGALYSNGLLQRYFRDVVAAAQHLAVSNVAYEGYGRQLLGIEDPNAPARPR